MLSTRIPFPLSVTIPANTGTGATLRSLITGNIPDATKEIWSVKILGLLADGTQRSALRMTSPRPGAAIATSDFTTHGRYYPAGVTVDEPSAFDLDSYVRSDSASTITAILLIQ